MAHGHDGTVAGELEGTGIGCLARRCRRGQRCIDGDALGRERNAVGSFSPSASFCRTAMLAGLCVPSRSSAS